VIATQTDLRALAGRLRTRPEIAIDCEFHGEGRYYPELCLVQISSGEEDAVAVDPLALDLAPLGEVLADPSIVKVCHAAENDIPLLARATGRPVRNVFDTQLAAAFAGHGAAPSYATLVERLCGVRPAKGPRFTDWTARPLSEEQLSYALDDVRYLPGVAEKLRRELARLGRLEWAAAAAEEMVAKALAPRDRSRLYLKLGRLRGLSPRQLAVLREAADWRDRRAEATDRPVQTVAPDQALLQLAYDPPRTEAEVRRLRGLQRIGGGAAGLLAAIKRALDLLFPCAKPGARITTPPRPSRRSSRPRSGSAPTNWGSRPR
jgi:ribonuclease D